MVGIHAKWLKMCNEISWREPIASLNIIETSHIWQQDHNGYTHQEPGFINHILNKKRDIINVYLPYDANSLIYYVDKSLKSKNRVNTIIASKHMRPQWLGKEETLVHCEKGIGVWHFASDLNPDITLACAGDTPTLEVMAATQILRDNGIKVRVVNVVDLITLESLGELEFKEIFPDEVPVIFNFHGYPSVIKGLTYDRDREFEIVHGYEEEGCITTPFDMRVINKIDRFHLVIDTLNLLGNPKPELKESMIAKLEEHTRYVRETGNDLQEVLEFKWHDKRD